MKQKSHILLLTFTLTLTFSLSSLHASEKTPPVKPFSKITASGIGTIHFTQSDHYSLKIEASEKIIDKIIVKNKDQILSLSVKNSGQSNRLHKITYTISSPNLDQIQLSGATSFQSDQLTSETIKLSNSGVSSFKIKEVTAETFELKSSGAGKTTLKDLTAKSSYTSLSGTSNATLTGNIPQQTIHISGASRYDAEQLESVKLNVKVSGTSIAHVHATESLKTNISGISQVFYYGTPDLIHNQSSRLSRLTAKE